MSKQGYELTGKIVEGYKISKAIGQGKFSIVYKAENQQGVPFAVKKIKIFDMADQKQREKCLKEVELMKPLQHPNIIEYVDSFIYNNELIIVTEWADKGDLKRLIRQHEEDETPFQQNAIWRYMHEIAGALVHMHQKRIMHRDLKPANIFVGKEQRLKVGDLGLGRAFSSETLEAYSKVGTPLYMSPELTKDEGYTENADVWSLGCIVYELCELNSPFRNKKEKMSLMDLFGNITKCNYKPISSRYSPQLSQAIRSMIVVDPAQRWSSRQAFDLADKMLQQVAKPRLDPLITMDDIHVKLELLNYKRFFCLPAQKPPISKFYFALSGNSGQQYNQHASHQDINSDQKQLHYFLELCYWVMALSKPSQHKKEKLAIHTKTLIDWSSAQAGCTRLLHDLAKFGVKTDEIEVAHIVQGFGQAVCYLLNEVLNRELIRSNFQFQPPRHTSELPSEPHAEGMHSEATERPSETVEDNIQDSIDRNSEDFEEQSQFQQSIFFNKNQRKEQNIGGSLLERIQQFDNDQQERTIIWGKADPNEWRRECERLGKNFTHIMQNAKENYKRQGHRYFETAKVCTAKINDLIHYVKPASTLLLKRVDQDLDSIREGEHRINHTFSGVGDQFRDQNASFKELSLRQGSLSTSIRLSLQELQKTEAKIEEVEAKIKSSSNANGEGGQGQSNIRLALTRLHKETRDLEQRKGILLMELNKHKLRLRRQGKNGIGLDTAKDNFDQF